MIELHHISLNYGQQQVLSDLNLAIPNDGKTIGIIGPNGAGKTTLINNILKRINTFKGQRQVPDAIAYLPDQPFLPGHIRLKAAIDLFIAAYPDFNYQLALSLLKTQHLNLQQRIHTLSRGMQQQAELALTLARQVPYYLFDEPLGAIDPRHRQNTYQMIQTARRSHSTVLIVTHLLKDLAPLFDEIWLLTNGRVAQQISRTQLQQNFNGDIEQYYQEMTTHA
ncbi:ATP-binding cassette domain-containing protein [Agrilactobacillus fermenti]|uniref:ATP-binding cassette domain-containing protein n=1 Tax=Agrilactobacillus fermenti TaxID=2586909 RepID=UPI001E385393|nr:ABC transporter ATP-binding protein [Agrilactobacillus fermenti]MCD2255948.1 ABC transporter ATP-binding protein [Agrilactobacillus fermenti]